MPISNKDIARYYDTTQIFYTLFWSRTALHYGFWYEDTKSLAEAMLNTNNFVGDALAMDSKDTVLDAGCGVGGTSMYVAETTRAIVEGATLSDVQLKIAGRRASKSPAARLLNFSKQDFTETNFREDTFSKVFGIESICYAHRKIDFLREYHRKLFLWPIDYLKSRLAIGREDLSSRYQKALFDRMIATYGVFVAVKSEL